MGMRKDLLVTRKSQNQKHRSSTIDEGVEHSNTAVAFLQNICTGIAERLVRKSASPTTRPDIVHRRPETHLAADASHG